MSARQPTRTRHAAGPALLLAALVLSGCAAPTGDGELAERLAAIEERLEDVEQRLAELPDSGGLEGASLDELARRLGSDDLVTAATDSALVRTIVCIVRVAIVADLLLGIEVAVATGPLSTRIGASIRIDLVAIITVFLRADHTISAASRLAVGQALVAIGPVAVITALMVGMF